MAWRGVAWQGMLWYDLAWNDPSRLRDAVFCGVGELGNGMRAGFDCACLGWCRKGGEIR